MHVLPWPEPLPAPAPEDTDDNWQMRIPPDSPDPEADAELLKIIYHRHTRPENVAHSLASYEEEDWQYVLERWAAIRQYHRQYILEHPDCITIDATITDPDEAVQASKRARQQRLDRQQWLSRLLIATPRVLAAAEYARIRRQIEPEDGMAPATGKGGRGKGPQSSGVAVVVTTAQGETVVASPTPAAQEPIVPIDFVSGATPQSGTLIAAPQVADVKRTLDSHQPGTHPLDHQHRIVPNVRDRAISNN